MYIFHIFMYNFLLKSYVQSNIHFFVVYVHFQSVYVHFVNKCALSYLSEKMQVATAGNVLMCPKKMQPASASGQMYNQTHIRMYIGTYK